MEQTKEYRQTYYQKNRDKMLDDSRKYQLENKDYIKAKRDSKRTIDKGNVSLKEQQDFRNNIDIDVMFSKVMAEVKKEELKQ